MRRPSTIRPDERCRTPTECDSTVHVQLQDPTGIRDSSVRCSTFEKIIIAHRDTHHVDVRHCEQGGYRLTSRGWDRLYTGSRAGRRTCLRRRTPVPLNIPHHPAGAGRASRQGARSPSVGSVWQLSMTVVRLTQLSARQNVTPSRRPVRQIDNRVLSLERSSTSRPATGYAVLRRLAVSPHGRASASHLRQSSALASRLRHRRL